MKAIQWHSDDPMTAAMCAQSTHATGQQYICSCSAAKCLTILVSWEWCVEVEAGPSIVSVSVWILGREMGPGYESTPMAPG